MDKQKIDLRLPLFFIWPFGAFLSSLFSLSSKRSGVIYVIFSTLFGYSFSFTETSADSYRVAWVLNEFNHGSLGKVFSKYRAGQIPDLYKYSLYSITESLGGNPKIMFAIFGFVFGIFSYKSLKLFFNDKLIEKSISVFILGLIFFSLNSIVNINGARFWTAAIIGFCSIINIIYFNKKIWFIGLFSLILFHFSYLFILPFILIIYLFKKVLLSETKTPGWLYTAFVLSFIFALILDSNVINLSSFSVFLPSSIARKVELYNSSEISAVYEERSKSLFHTVSKTFGYSARAYIFFLIYKIRKQLSDTPKPDPGLQKLFNFVLVFFSITFMLSLFPSGGRFVIIATQIFFFFFIRFYVRYKSDTLQKYVLGLIPVYAFIILFNVGFLVIALTSGTIWYGNVFWLIYEGVGYKFSLM